MATSFTTCRKLIKVQRFHSFGVSHTQKVKVIGTDSRMVVTRGWAVGGRGDVDQMVQTCSYKMNKF